MTTTEKQEQEYIAERKRAIELRNMVNLLRSTPEWKTVIQELYCTNNLRANTIMLATVRQQESKAQYQEAIAAVGHLDNFLAKLVNEGDQAEADLYSLAYENGAEK